MVRAGTWQKPGTQVGRLFVLLWGLPEQWQVQAPIFRDKKVVWCHFPPTHQPGRTSARSIALQVVAAAHHTKSQNPAPCRGIFTRAGLTVSQHRVNTYSPQTVQKYRNGRKTSKLIIWGYHYLDSETRQRPHLKGELQTNTPDEHGCKNSQHDSSKSNSKVH